MYGQSGHGFFKSTDAGQSWFPFDKGLPVSTYSFGSFAPYTRQTSSRMTLFLRKYIDILDPGLGYYSTKENDDQWTFVPIRQINSTGLSLDLRNRYVLSDDSLAVLVQNSGQYDSTSGIFCSVDGGKKWVHRTDSLLPLNSGLNVMGLGHTLFVSEGGVAQAGSQPSWLIYRSDDFGLHWNLMTVPTADSVMKYLYPYSDGTLMLLNQGTFDGIRDSSNMNIYLSSDTGRTWIPFNGVHPAGSIAFNITGFGSVGQFNYVGIE